MEKETWKRLDETEILVSSHGRIKNSETGLILKQRFNKKGYFVIGRIKYSQLVHRIVCHCFNPLSEFIGAQVNHKDGNKQNNHFRNLEWCTCKENIDHAFKTGLRSAMGSKNNFSIFNERQVMEIRKNYKGKDRRQYAKSLGINEGTLKSVLSKRNWKHI